MEENILQPEEQGFVIENGVLLKYTRWDQSEITIPEGVTEIADSAFGPVKIQDTYSAKKAHEEIQKVVFPKTLMKIGSSAFERCNKMEEVRIQAENLEIGEGAFSGCRGLLLVNIQARTCILGKLSFNDTRCQSLSIQAEQCTIGERAFSWVKMLTDVSLECGSISIEESAFYFCNLTQIDLTHCTHVGYKAFAACPLFWIDLPEGDLSCISDCAFEIYGKRKGECSRPPINTETPKDIAIGLNRSIPQEDIGRLFGKVDRWNLYLLTPQGCQAHRPRPQESLEWYMLRYAPEHIDIDAFTAELQTCPMDRLFHLLSEGMPRYIYHEWSEWLCSNGLKEEDPQWKQIYVNLTLLVAGTLAQRWDYSLFAMTDKLMGRPKLRKWFATLRSCLNWLYEFDVPEEKMEPICDLMGKALFYHYGEKYALYHQGGLQFLQDGDELVEAIGFTNSTTIDAQYSRIRDYAFRHTKIHRLKIDADVPMGKFVFSGSHVAQLFFRIPAKASDFCFAEMHHLSRVDFLQGLDTLAVDSFMRNADVITPQEIKLCFFTLPNEEETKMLNLAFSGYFRSQPVSDPFGGGNSVKFGWMDSLHHKKGYRYTLRRLATKQ